MTGKSDHPQEKYVLTDLFRLLLGHLTRYRGPELADVITKGIRESATYPGYVLKIVNASLSLRKWLTNVLYFQPRYLKSRIAFQMRNCCFTSIPTIRRKKATWRISSRPKRSFPG
jgi:hypothetical protein